ncbi:PepSY domain-containing protein [Vibrio ordalii]|uniref:PepSY domain-containing protein n=1 Tax=Vibrio ordalii TaxID=28174 RepID=UPI000313B1C1|nr:PepSY domain-containing protein [Vibrio ordalii]OEE76617.1 hypothetical protein A1QQ_15235 [Vibrio ordalii FF-167]
MLFKKGKAFARLLLLSSLSLPTLAASSDIHDWVQDTYKPGTKVEMDEDQDEVYAAVQKGLIHPLSELYATIDKELNGRVIKVELDEDDGEWVYELKLMHDNRVIRVEYNASTLELIAIRGRNLRDIIKK